MNRPTDAGAREWIGGRLERPHGEAGGSLGFALWVDASAGDVIAFEHAPMEDRDALARALASALERHDAPSCLRVADPSTASSVRAAVRGRIPITVAPTPEIDDLLGALDGLDALDVRAGGSSVGERYLDLEGATPQLLETLFGNAATLYESEPWDFLDERDFVRLDIPALGVDGACLSIIGAEYASPGLVVFDSPTSAEAFVDALDRDDDVEVFARLSLEFVPASEAIPSLLHEAEAFERPVASLAAFPMVLRWRDDRDELMPSARDLRVVSLAVAALVEGVGDSVHKRTGGTTFRAEYADPTDPETIATVVAPYERPGPRENSDEKPYVDPPAAPRLLPSRKVGRNDPCPCGSGRKYKRCHLSIDRNEADVARRSDDLDDRESQLVRELMTYAVKRFGRAWFDDARRRTGSEPIWGPWAVYQNDAEGRTVAEWFLEERGRRLGESDRALLRAQSAAWITIWEVTAVSPGERLTLVDLLSGEARTVTERTASETLVPYDGVLGRIVDHDGDSYLWGLHPRSLPPSSTAQAVETARKRLGIGAGPMPLERLRGGEPAARLIELWREEVEALDAASARPVRLQTTDGSPLVFLKDRYDVAPDARIVVESALRAMEGIRVEADGDGRLVFLRGRTVIGGAEFLDSELEVETTAVDRADELRERIERTCGDHVVHRSRDEMQPGSLPAAPTLGEGHGLDDPGARDAVRQMKERHYAEWPDLPLPALEGRTPRGATETPEGRVEVEILLKTMHNHETRQGGEHAFDFGPLWRDLGFKGGPP